MERGMGEPNNELVFVIGSMTGQVHSPAHQNIVVFLA
jgi:hypothetical protein